MSEQGAMWGVSTNKGAISVAYICEKEAFKIERIIVVIHFISLMIV